MRVFAIGIELPHDVPVERPHESDPRKHRRAVKRKPKFVKYRRTK
jgi:hypothetical protein